MYKLLYQITLVFKLLLYKLKCNSVVCKQ